MINQQIAVELLGQAGISVDVVGTGKAAVDKLRQVGPTAYDLVFMDLQMPEMDGHQATIVLRKEKRFDDLPIIAMTADAMAAERERCLAEGMNDHIAKPIDPEGLYRLLQHWLKSKLSEKPESAGKAKSAVAKIPENAPTIEGIDMAGGLRRVNGNQALYQRLLRQFRTHQISVPATIHNALTDGDFETAERLAHTLKGVAGNIGASKVQSVAGEIESAIHRRAALTDINALLAEAILVLEPLGRALDGYLPAEVLRIAEMPSNADMSRYSGDFARLVDLVRASDSDAPGVFESIAPWIANRYGADVCLNIRRYLDDFDFDRALSVLTGLGRKTSSH
jgi:CheY-like chemotaxis protein/HPt (histidine-containing phosphotransfer) domain-containing protein